ncbi:MULTISPECIES: sensor histidine kinase [unclassified Paenibacillus]|uniref:sensor histidine kinase n=1 Tax=unclassified Paenibacillus TaxID=185978 RepID=UPI0010478DF1|nr:MULTISPECIES: sensor histidine kinase [unclassified Paenibacillus]NIK66769.1 sensor histidine kinase YesM [Paenibacillus sp. BK720]TCN00749.1 histidine kinase/DNA gyrase B/HSP90-like ATPase [Paenibacillus sp. BK033]
MTLRKKLLLFIPLLVLLTNGVTFFLFESSKTVQHSYNTMMDRMLLYTQSAQTADANVQALYAYLLNPEDNSRTSLLEQQAELTQISGQLDKQRTESDIAGVLEGYVHMLQTLAEQVQSAEKSAAPDEALGYYEDTERTGSFIREEERRLIDLELSAYEPVYRSIQLEIVRMDWLGPAVFIINTLLSIVVALWISRSITEPVDRLVLTARHLAKGQLDAAYLPERSNDELGILSEAFRHMIKDLTELMGRDKERLESERLVKELELQALQSQINPHFLFNTLNVLSKLALLEGADRTSDLIVSMSKLIRYNLSQLDRPVTLGDELKHVREYFTIQQARFRNRVEISQQIDESALNMLIPALTIQPLVENAFVHGVERLESGGRIQLTIERSGDRVRIVIKDNGAGMKTEERDALLALQEPANPAPAKKNSMGFGTRNVIKRLRLFYNRQDVVNIESEPGRGTSVILLLPNEADVEQKGGPEHDVPSIDRR